MSSTRAVVNVYEAKTQLSSLLDRAMAGEEIVIARRGKELVRLLPVAPAPAEPRRPSPLFKVLWIADDFDAPDPEIIRLFEGDDDEWTS